MIKRKKNSDTDIDLKLPRGVPEGFVRTRESGLSDEEAEKLAAEGLSNRASEDAGKSPARIIADNVFTLFNLLNIILAALLLSVGAYRNMLFLGVVVSNTLTGIITELRARRTVKLLKLASEAPVKVRRGGRELSLSAEETVLGDIVLLRAGDQVPADAVMLSGVCSACEALLTGEQDAIEKKELDRLYSGSYITSGTAVCQLVGVGDESYINRLTRSAKKIVPPTSMLMKELSRIVRFVSAALIPIGILLFVKQYFLMHMDIGTVIPKTVAAMLGMIPEGLILLVSVTLAVGVIRLGRKRTLVQELYGIETLARIDTLCLDKTGTLTTGAMTLEELVPFSVTKDELSAALSRYLGAIDDASSPTVSALAAAVGAGDERAKQVLPFSSERKFAAVSFCDGSVLALGAPSFVLKEGYTDEIKASVESRLGRGRRVVVLAECAGDIVCGALPAEKKVLGFAVIADEMRRGVEDCLGYFEKQGVALKIISGDDPKTVAAIAESAGLSGAGKSAADVSQLEESELESASKEYTVFGRVTPDRKKKLIQAMKKAGLSVAMTGDGVNDIPALKSADCSIAMAAGADATRHSAQIVLLDSDFTAIPGVVAEGRRVINNVTRTASLFLLKTTYSFLLSLLTVFLPASYPFQPIQLTLVSALTIGAPSFFLALEPNAEPVRGNFLRTVLMNAAPGGVTVTVLAAAASMFSGVWSPEVCSTVATVSAGFIGLTMLLTVCLPFTPLRAAVFAAMTVGFSLACLFFGKLFYLVPLTGAQLAVLAGFCAFGAALFTGIRLVLKRIAKKHEEKARTIS